MQRELKRTPLYEAHRAAGARMGPFGGWEMPIQYTGIIEEHRAVRTAAGLFDVSHMGEIEIKGPGAVSLIQHLVTNDVGALQLGKPSILPCVLQKGESLTTCWCIDLKSPISCSWSMPRIRRRTSPGCFRMPAMVFTSPTERRKSPSWLFRALEPKIYSSP